MSHAAPGRRLSPGSADAVGAIDDYQVVESLAPQRHRGGSPPNPAPMITTRADGRRRATLAHDRRSIGRATSLMDTRADLEPLRRAAMPGRLEDVGVLGRVAEEEAALTGLRVRLTFAIVIAGCTRLRPPGARA